MHLGDQRSPALSCWHHLAPNDLDCMSPGPVPGAHVAVALGDGGAHGEVPVLAVHVVCSRPRVVPGEKSVERKGQNQKSSHLNQTPKFLIFRGFFSLISSTDTISPVVFLNFLSCLRKYQNLGNNHYFQFKFMSVYLCLYLDLATIWSVAKILILGDVIMKMARKMLLPITCREGSRAPTLLASFARSPGTPSGFPSPSSSVINACFKSPS